VPTSITVAQVVLRRRNDPGNEYRTFEILQVGSHFQIWERISFAGARTPFRHTQVKIGSAHTVRQALKQEIERLCTEEEFALVSRDGVFLDG